MNDPWDVKAVRLGHQYQSCMKINGVPLLPPVLSQECRKEMQYYKLLAKEVEKRISILKPYIDPDSDEDRTDAPEITEDAYQSPLEDNFETPIDFVDKYSPRHENKKQTSLESPKNNKYNSKHVVQDTHILVDMNVKNSGERDLYNSIRSPRQTSAPVDDEVPERDCDYQNHNEKKEVLTDLETEKIRTPMELIDSIMNDFNISDKEDCISLPLDGPPSLSTKSFTGSLNDIHVDSSKESQQPKLVRQRSYTVLQPSPQLLAHLEIHSISTGVEVNSISMSESMSQINQGIGKRRKSWDLESAKVKWSSMAMELKTKNIVSKTNCASKGKSKTVTKKSISPADRANSVKEKDKKQTVTKPLPVSEPVTMRTNGGAKNGHSSVNVVVGKTPSKGTSSPINVAPRKAPKSPNKIEVSSPKLITELDDPAERVKELYEKLQKQQVMQMENLIEKQKKEQQLLQKVFEEQNNILLKQLKTVCPKSSFEVKQAWGDVKDNNDRGPVSLSQLMNTSTPLQSETTSPVSPVSKTLTETNRYINKCDDVLKKSRNITNSIRKSPGSRKTNGSCSPGGKDNSQRSHVGSISKTRSPRRNTSRKLEYENPLTDEQILTDSNDTLADLNDTFPSDYSDGHNTLTKYRKMSVARACSPMSGKMSNTSGRTTETSIKDLENTIQSSIDSLSKHSNSVAKHSILNRLPSTKERVAATKIVAYAKGYLVRRLMRTERVQTTVQTIRDALLCALQLHQDREGIRGADVDLHRRLIQQITSACYTLHDTFVTSTSTERCAMIAADRYRKQALASKQATPLSTRRSLNVMSQSHSGAFPSRVKRVSGPSAGLMTQSHYESLNVDKSKTRYVPAQRSKAPWR